MKIITVSLLLSMPAAVVAQNYPGMTEADMRVMQKIEKMQTCLSKVDQGQLQMIEQRQEQFDAEVQSLCGSGKRDEAQKKAVLYEKEMAGNPALEAMSKCEEIAKDMMSYLPYANREEDATDQHVCDSM